ncbi:alpha/beta fold hydrolase [Kribbella sp. CA-253562]|uniref:alpha/beta fold hydrolase n=1 Tax=Kribbella sp. CA-253562 TaxID=3239942 RepID=UPI003D8FC229
MTLLCAEYGAGRPILLLHGGGGPQTVEAFGARLAAALPAQVVIPTHPGFGGTTRPDDLTTIAGLARRYADLLDERDLHDVVVIGSSIGGWIAAELALLGSARLGALVLVDAVGIDVPDHPVADFFALSFDEIAALSYHAPDAFRIDPTQLSPAAREQLAANRAALAVYAGEPSMVDPALRSRLASVTTPTLVVWGDSDRIVTPDYGRAYAEAIPGAEFRILPDTGHLPQLETPDQVIAALRAFSSTAGSR